MINKYRLDIVWVTCKPDVKEVLQPIISITDTQQVYIVDLWNFPYTKKIFLITSNLGIASKLNKYDNVNIALASEDVIFKMVKVSWIRQYLLKQMPAFVPEEICSMIQSGENAEDVWKLYVDTWLPNKTAKDLLDLGDA